MMYRLHTYWWFSKVDLNLDSPPANSFSLMAHVDRKDFNHALVSEKSVELSKTKHPISTTVLLSDDEAYSCFSQFLSTVGITLDRDHIFHSILSDCRAITTSEPFSRSHTSTEVITRNRDQLSDTTDDLFSRILSGDIEQVTCSSTTSTPFFFIDMMVTYFPWPWPWDGEVDEDVDEDHDGLKTVPWIGGYIDKCIICFVKFRVGSEVTRMPCDHVYHEDCIIHWLEISNFCPICRFKMPTAE
ncbi:uncharacterized protein LOC132294429 [Cornus florida]|uniref:uncharacterized protein LOC132294429 n=1 Tax=Cornus florida TaxID=4283 RepID=UPI002896FFF3|nr:uncharacterized protein LOC132294429 [Cornus florida]